MNKLMKILAFIIFFATITIFTGAVSATNLTVNLEKNIRADSGDFSDNYIPINNLTDIHVKTASLSSNNATINEKNITSSKIQDLQAVNTTGIVMSRTVSNCGPALLATVLQKMNINVSQDVIAAIAGTDENGTTMYGLAKLAQLQGLIAKGLN